MCRAYIILLKTVQRSYPTMVSSFYVHVSSFHEFRHLREYSMQPCFFREYVTHTRPSVSQKMTKLNKRGLCKQWKWSEFSSKRQPGLFCPRNFLITPFTAVTSYDNKNPYGTHHDELDYGTHKKILMCVTSVSSLKLRLKVCKVQKRISLIFFTCS